jgi:hypothetical protein
LQAGFIILTVGLTRFIVAGATIDAAALGRDLTEAIGILLYNASFMPADGYAQAALVSSSCFVVVANLAARIWDGTGPLGCVVGISVAIVGVIATIAVVARISSAAHDSGDVTASWFVGAVGVGLVLLWTRLIVLAADAPIDLRHAVAVARDASSKNPPTSS